MIVCPNCNHQNPDGAVQCEACYTPLPSTTACPNCGANVQTDASFCGQCGFNLRATPPHADLENGTTPPSILPDLLPPEPLIEPDPLMAEASEPFPIPSEPVAPILETPSSPSLAEEEAPSHPDSRAAGLDSRTQLQQQTARLLHIQTNTEIELPQSLAVIHIGKPNDRIPPDVDVSGFPNSEIVSRIHADIRIEGDSYYIEDVGSSNGTYINNLPLSIGNRHRLRPGDRVALGKGDKVTFLFQLI